MMWYLYWTEDIEKARLDMNLKYSQTKNCPTSDSEEKISKGLQEVQSSNNNIKGA